MPFTIYGTRRVPATRRAERHTACACYTKSGTAHGVCLLHEELNGTRRVPATRRAERHTACACYTKSGTAHGVCLLHEELDGTRRVPATRRAGRHTACACYTKSWTAHGVCLLHEERNGTRRVPATRRAERHTACACYTKSWTAHGVCLLHEELDGTRRVPATRRAGRHTACACYTKSWTAHGVCLLHEELDGTRRVPATRRAERQRGVLATTELRAAGREKPPLAVIGDQRQRVLIALSGFGFVSEAPQKIGAHGMQQVITVENSCRREGVDLREGRLRSFRHGEGHRTVERHDGRGLQLLESIVEPEDLGPVGIFGARPGSAGRRLPPGLRAGPRRRELPRPRAAGPGRSVDRPSGFDPGLREARDRRPGRNGQRAANHEAA